MNLMKNIFCKIENSSNSVRVREIARICTGDQCVSMFFTAYETVFLSTKKIAQTQIKHTPALFINDFRKILNLSILRIIFVLSAFAFFTKSDNIESMHYPKFPFRTAQSYNSF